MGFCETRADEPLRGDLGEVGGGVPPPRYRSPLLPLAAWQGFRGLPVLAFGCAPVPPAPLT